MTDTTRTKPNVFDDDHRPVLPDWLDYDRLGIDDLAVEDMRQAAAELLEMFPTVRALIERINAGKRRIEDGATDGLPDGVAEVVWEVTGLELATMVVDALSSFGESVYPNDELLSDALTRLGQPPMGDAPSGAVTHQVTAVCEHADLPAWVNYSEIGIPEEARHVLLEVTEQLASGLPAWRSLVERGQAAYSALTGKLSAAGISPLDDEPLHGLYAPLAQLTGISRFDAIQAAHGALLGDYGDAGRHGDEGLASFGMAPAR